MFDIERNNASYARISAAIEKGRTDSYLTVVISIICGLIPAIRIISRRDISDEVK